MKAVLKSGVNVPMILFENVDPRAFNVIDQGERRSPYDVLRTSPSAAAIVRIVVRMCEADSKPSFARMLPYYEALRMDEWPEDLRVREWPKEAGSWKTL